MKKPMTTGTGSQLGHMTSLGGGQGLRDEGAGDSDEDSQSSRSSLALSLVSFIFFPSILPTEKV